MFRTKRNVSSLFGRLIKNYKIVKSDIWNEYENEVNDGSKKANVCLLPSTLANSHSLKGGSINYHRKVFYVAPFTFCHLVDSFYIKQAAPQQFKQV